MGTFYHIKVVTWFFTDTTALKKAIESRLEAINRSMSTYRPDSEISHFNALKIPGEAFKISEDFYRVMCIAQKLYHLTEGAWDGTVNPLVNLWGFGVSHLMNRIPEKQDIESVLGDTGFYHIHISDQRTLTKLKATVSLDLASIAKGYAVDEIATVIRRSGKADYLVEIGGEVYASGLRKDGLPWKIGINLPQKYSALDDIYQTVNLHNKALATSGDYRNFFEMDGKTYSHVIDPMTGYPVNNGVVSVSIIADNCTVADGLATALMVMGHEKGLALVNAIPDVECLIVVREQDGELKDHCSSRFNEYLWDQF